jgi:hypothetical protein
VKRAAGSELHAFLGAFSPEIARIALRLRSLVLEEAPVSNEFIYDPDNTIAMSYGFTDRPNDAFCHIAVYSEWVNLGFQRGSQLPDPDGLLDGTGRWIRHLRMASLDDLRRPFVGRFLRAAIEAAPRPEGETGKRSAPRSVVRGVYAKKRRPDKPAQKKEGA